MPGTVALIVFHATSERTETVAMSAAVGAVQARALIRLRRVADAGSRAPSDGDVDDAALGRMQKEYVAPTEADLLGADALLLVPPPNASPVSPEWAPFVSLLGRLGAEGTLAGKVCAVVHTGDPETVTAFSRAVLVPGLVLVPPVVPASDADCATTAISHGRHVAELARALKPT